METVNKVVDAGYKALWGEDTQQQQQQQQHATATGSTETQSSLTSVIDAGKKALWGTSTDTSSDQQQTTPHGEEPVSGEQGLGTAMDPFDAGNREEEEAIPTSHATEQRNIETSQGDSSGTTAPPVAAAPEPDMLKTTVTGLKRDPSEPSHSVTESPSRVTVDNGPGQSLKHTSEPFQKESDKLVQDLKGETPQPETPKAAVATEPAVTAITAPVPSPTPASILDEAASASKSSKDETKQKDASKSSSSGTSSDASVSEKQGQEQKKTKISKLEKVKNKLHIGSPKAK